MKFVRKTCLGVAGIALVALIAGLAIGNADWWQPAAVAAGIALAIGFGSLPALRPYQFTVWIIVAVVAAMIYPSALSQVGSVRLSGFIPIIVQLVMFGMGTQMSLRDFAGVTKMPWAVFVGIVCQFSIMPLVGFGLTKLFNFPPEIGAGIILIGSCSSGLASNVMVYLARGNLALSITLTSITTLLAPLMTPTWMKLLADERGIQIDFFQMMMDIIQMVIVPIAAALLHDYLKRTAPRGRNIIISAAVLAAAWLIFWNFGGSASLATSTELAAGAWLRVVTFICWALVVGVIYHALTLAAPALDQHMPVLSMFGIIFYTAVTTAVGRDALMNIGGLLFLAALIHNTMGYTLGYWMSRALGMDRTSARTVAFEVGLQNGGMATGLAEKLGRLGTIGLAATIFSPWQNVSGSILANYWRKRPSKADGSAPQE